MARSSSSSSSFEDTGSLSPESNASTNLTNITCTSRKSSGNLFDLETTFKSDPVGKDNVFIALIPDNEHQDPMFMSSWRILAARLVGFTAVAPELLGLFLCRYQFGGLMARWWNDEALTATHMLISSGLLTTSMVGCFEGLSMASVKLGALFSHRHPRLCLLGENVPSVDVFVTVCNEKFDVVRDTVIAALHIDYPRQRFRVIVTDDGNSEKLRAWINEMMADYTNLYYHSRTERGGWKAGNLNYAIKFTDNLPGGAAECVAGLDADMIPEPRWLRTVTAHLMKNDTMGMVCPTQMFYNIPTDDPLYQANNFDWYAKRLIFDLAGNGWNYGSGWIMRRKAVDDIGGFPEDIVTEDVSSSAMTMAAGWKTMYLQEGLQYGLVPDTYAAYIKQMTRWHVGESQTATKFGFYNSKTKHMRPMQKWVQTAQGLNVHIKTTLTIINLMLLSLVFLTDMPLVHWQNQQQMCFLLRLDCAIVLLRWLHELHYSIVAGYRSTLNETCKAIYLSPYCFMSYVRAFIMPTNLGGEAISFTPTGSIKNEDRERDPRRRAPLWQRFRHIIVDAGAWFHLTIATLFVTAVALRIGRAVDLHLLIASPDWEGFWTHILKNVAWPSNPWLISTLACITPLQYGLFPPTTLDREKLLTKRDENGVRYPLENVRGKVRRSKFTVGFVEVYSVYMTVILAVLFTV